MNTIHGLIYKFGNNIDTDQIYPGRYLELTEPDEIGQHAMEGADPTFHSRFVKGGVIVAGTNFGCGSSREHAVIALKNAGVSAVIAKSFARIFYRNCINLALPAIMIPELDDYRLAEGDDIEINLIAGTIKSGGILHNFPPLPENILELIEKGGVFALYKS